MLICVSPVMISFLMALAVFRLLSSFAEVSKLFYSKDCFVVAAMVVSRLISMVLLYFVLFGLRNSSDST